MYKARQSLALYIRKEGKSLLSLLGEINLIVVQHLSQHNIQIAEVVVAGLQSVHLSLRQGCQNSSFWPIPIRSNTFFSSSAVVGNFTHSPTSSPC